VVGRVLFAVVGGLSWAAVVVLVFSLGVSAGVQASQLGASPAAVGLFLDHVGAWAAGGFAVCRLVLLAPSVARVLAARRRGAAS
jgi:hypothetical protein